MGISQKLWVNFLGFQVYWWACILYQNNALALCIGLLILHLYFHELPVQEVTSVIILGLIGYSIDVLLTLFQLFQFPSSLDYLPPIWLLFLWLGFATSITTLFHRHHINLSFGAAVGALTAPLSYLAAAKLGAVTLPFGYFTTWIILMPVWFVLVPVLLYSQRKIKEFYFEN